MPASLARACCLSSLLLAAACGGPTPAPPAAPAAPQTSGTLQLPGLRAPVTVVRDTWGIAHLTAENDEDLFFAQGFVQAQDRLFQMDLWKRAAQGRLSEVLGANFIDRDAMTRRVQFRGDIDREWASYGPDSHAIAVAFTSGVNAWVARARAQLPEEFVLAGWTPELWKPEDLLNRTDAFLASGQAIEDLVRARLAAAIGPARAAQVLPLPPGASLTIDAGVDLSAITYLVPDTLRRIGTAPFFLTLAAPPSAQPRLSRAAASPEAPAAAAPPPGALLLPPPGGSAFAVGRERSATGAALLAVQVVRPFAAPAQSYLVHLSSPGFEVAGATVPWLPGVLLGHNQRVAWGMTPVAVDTQDVFVERLNPADAHQVEHDGAWIDMTVDHERVDVKGRVRPFEFDRQYTPNGVVIALDRGRQLVYTLRWSGAEPGGALGLAALAIDRARTWSEFQSAIARWTSPPVDFVYGDVEGRTARVTAGLIPRRPAGAGAAVTAGWDRTRAWRGWADSVMAPPNRAGSAWAAAGNDRSGGVAARLEALLSAPGRRTLDDMQAMQRDVHAAAAARLLPLLAAARAVPPALETARATLAAWDGEVRADSAAAHLYVRWDAALRRLLAERVAPGVFAADLAPRFDIVDLLTRPRAPWFDGAATAQRDALLVGALASAVEGGAAGGSADGDAADRSMLVFRHPLAVFDAGRRRFDVGPLSRPGYYDTVFATDPGSGPTFRAVFDAANWDRSVAVVAPGQSGSASSPHYDDLARVWADGGDVPLVFSAAAVAASAAETLRLMPGR